MDCVTRAQLRRRDRCRCILCGRSKHLTSHHIKPQSIGGTSELRNLMTLCRPCHEWIEEPIRKLFADLASVVIWLLIGPVLWLARRTAPLRWNLAHVQHRTNNRSIELK